MAKTMIEKLMTMLVGILLALAGWNLSRTFELSTTQAVLENQIDQLEFRVQMLDEKMDKMMDSDEEIMDQHKKLFEKLESGNTGYSYN
jgi:predicted nuclease with TOPRIM domain|tara:strand:+ start:240 stop:503 length:264 start_codon:yes stop_codon:yes gene_type:complete